ncbi:hypothetical protein ACI2K4_24200 [Micromonospora sp. NPDC050397]|uniref:hypothetical protein n=1 Tax=Micromonospora sp. NPDC050397 TaxID=3364279 RepID=UPI00384BE635
MVSELAPPGIPIPLRVEYDHRLGGRWTSLTGGGRQWLWTGPQPGRDRVLPGDAFVDAGGLEECLPTVRGTPDHGAAWSRPWRQLDPATATVDCPDFTLTRRLTERDGVVLADYRLLAAPGYRFVWAAHALLDLSPRARLLAPAGTPTRLYPEAAELLPEGTWPERTIGTGPEPTGGAGPEPTGGAGPDQSVEAGPNREGSPAPWYAAPWPSPAGLPLARFGPDDGTAVGAVLVDCARVQVVDGPDTLTLELDCADQPRATALWRNLGGWPADRPYRSIGVEPMLGGVFDLAEADLGGGANAAVVPASGEVTWQLTISAHRSPGGDHR